MIDTLVRGMGEKTAGPFQAPELPFYYLHARLWLLIVLARMAIDHPKDVSRYGNELLSIFEERTESHVLMHHFALRGVEDLHRIRVARSTGGGAAAFAWGRGINISTIDNWYQGMAAFQRGRPESISRIEVQVPP